MGAEKNSIVSQIQTLKNVQVVEDYSIERPGARSCRRSLKRRSEVYCLLPSDLLYVCARMLQKIATLQELVDVVKCRDLELEKPDMEIDDRNLEIKEKN